MHALVHIQTFNSKDNVVQMARCSFDIHVQEVLGTLMTGATLIMLRPRGTMDFTYLCRIIDTKQITYMHTVPTLHHGMGITHLKDHIIHSCYLPGLLLTLCQITVVFTQ